MEQLLRPRRIVRAVSENPSTSRTRKYEMCRVGISSAIRKIKAKWRARKKKAVDRFLSCSLYQEFSEMRPNRCSEYITILKEKFDALRDQEIEMLKLCLAGETPVNSNPKSSAKLIEVTINSLSVHPQKLRNIAPAI